MKRGDIGVTGYVSNHSKSKKTNQINLVFSSDETSKDNSQIKVTSRAETANKLLSYYVFENIIATLMSYPA